MKEDSYIIYSIDNIAKFCGCNKKTIMRWYKREGFPIVRGLRGLYQTTPGLIDLWLLSLMEEQINDDPRKAKLREFVPYRYPGPEWLKRNTKKKYTRNKRKNSGRHSFELC